MRETAEIKRYCALGKCFGKCAIGKCLSPNIVYKGKITSTQPDYNDKVYFGVTQKSFKDFTTTPNPLHMKITQMTQNCRKITGKLKGKTLFQK